MKKLSTSKLKREKQGKFQELSPFEKLITRNKLEGVSMSGKFFDILSQE